jgi:quinol-cytochrome oxidoreductase complex cytochrome b subunit
LVQHREIVDWVDNRLGLTAAVLKPVPEYSLDPLYWLGALMVMAFLIQGITGLLILLYYVPTVDQAYVSTLFMIEHVPLGQLIQTLHLYSAYAMILLAFMHLLRQYFASVQKKPRELMWVVGILMGLVVLAFGLTGYLLPWTVVSKSATDVAVGMLGFLPGQVGASLRFLIAGSGSDASELTRFFVLHIVALPAALLVLLGLKMYMFEVHGAAEPLSGVKDKTRMLPWFPEAFLYLVMLSGVFVGLLLAASVLFPLSLPPKFTPQTAASYTPQPDWYFLWVYQILKFSAFEGSGVIYALTLIPLILVVVLMLPFYDRGKARRISQRPTYVTIGMIAVAELVVLTVWGYMTPGQVIPDSQAIMIIAGTALIVSVFAWAFYRTRTGSFFKPAANGSRVKSIAALDRFPMLTALFSLFLAVACVTVPSSIRLLASPGSHGLLLASESILSALSLYLMSRILKSLVVIHSVEVGLP